MGGCKRIVSAFEALTHEDAKPAEPPPIPVVTGAVDRRDVEVWGDWVATVDGSVNANIRPRVSGYLISQNYTEGAFLRTGDLMFEIDPRPFVAALEHAKAALARTQADQTKTQLDVDRLTPLVAKRAVSQQELDDAIGANNANLAMIEANKADIAIAELNLGFTRIIAPIDGIAGKANAQIGDLVGPASPEPLTSMSTLDPVTVYFFPPESEYFRAVEQIVKASGVPLDQRPERFELVLADGSTFGQKGRFYFVDRQVDSRTGAIRVGVRFANPGNVLRPGQFATIRAIRESLSQAVVVPQQAVIDVQGSYQVAVVGSGNVVEMRDVTVGPVDGGDQVILEGLDGGETIVVQGIQKVRNGVKVAPETAKPATPPAAGPKATGGTKASEGPKASGGGGTAGAARPARSARPAGTKAPSPTPAETTPQTGAPQTGAPQTGAPQTGAPQSGAPQSGSPSSGAAR